MRARTLLPIALALLALYVPIYWDMAHGPWQTDEQAHAPLIALASAWLAWRGRAGLGLAGPAVRSLGGGLLGLGLLTYAGGRVLAVPLLELGSQIPVLAGLMLWLGGWALLRAFAFPLFFLAFMLPLPGILVEALTSPLKLWISIWAEELLYLAGYPVARSGVILSLSQYRLLVADACTGLYSTIFLSAMGLLYLHLVAHRPRLHKAILLASLLPIALAANLARVLALLLITYHFGDAIGQGPLHDLTGVGVFVLALLLLYLLDTLLLAILPSRVRPHPLRPGAVSTLAAPTSRPQGARLALPLFLTAGLAHAWPLLPAPQASPDLEAMVPAHFAGWRQEQGLVPLQAATTDPDYRQTLARTYVNEAGERIMLSIAYGPNQLNDRLHAHRPEYCYQAQGFQVTDGSDDDLATARGVLPLRRLLTTREERSEPVSYWMTIGNQAVLPGLARKLAQLRHGLAGEVPDGLLVRVSSLDREAGKAYALQDRFIQDMLLAVATPGRFGLPTAATEGQ